MGSDNKPGQQVAPAKQPLQKPDYGLWFGNCLMVFLLGMALIYFVSMLRGILSADYSKGPIW